MITFAEAVEMALRKAQKQFDPGKKVSHPAEAWEVLVQIMEHRLKPILYGPRPSKNEVLAVLISLGAMTEMMARDLDLTHGRDILIANEQDN